MTRKRFSSSTTARQLDETTPIGTFAVPASPQSVGRALRMGLLPEDRAFDRALPPELRPVSGQYWTPLCVAARAADWFQELGVRTVVDIGSGAGKFCVATALLAADCELIGLEQRPRLVRAANALARTFEVEDRVRFVQGTFGKMPTPSADAYYLYNPFGECLFGDSRLGDDVELTDSRYERDIKSVVELLVQVPVGTCLLTYNGFGGRVPPGFREVRVDRELPNVLHMWRKDSVTPAHVMELPADPRWC